MGRISYIMVVAGIVALSIAGFDLIDYDRRGIVAVVAVVTIIGGVIVELVERGYWE